MFLSRYHSSHILTFKIAILTNGMIKVILVINLNEKIGAMYIPLYNHLPHASSELICNIKLAQPLKEKKNLP